MRFAKRMIHFLLVLALLLFLMVNIYAEHSGRYLVHVPHKLLFSAGFVVLWVLVIFFDATATEPAQIRRRRFQHFLIGLFLYYIWILSNMLFFDATFGRTETPLMRDIHFYAAQVNLKPLKTIRNYMKAYARGTVGQSVVAINLLGNMVAFAPMGVFLPALCRKMRRIYIFLPTILLLICFVEGMQFLTHTGSCDIDDLILNAFGALLCWLIVQLPPIKRWMLRIK